LPLEAQDSLGVNSALGRLGRSGREALRAAGRGENLTDEQRAALRGSAAVPLIEAGSERLTREGEITFTSLTSEPAALSRQSPDLPASQRLTLLQQEQQRVQQQALKEQQHLQQAQERQQARIAQERVAIERGLADQQTAKQQERYIQAGAPGTTGQQDIQPTLRGIEGFQAQQIGGHVHYYAALQGTGQAAPGRASTASFIDKGQAIDIPHWQDQNSVLAALQLSAQKWDSFAVHGNDPYKALCVKLAVQHGLKINNPELQQAIQQEQALQQQRQLQTRNIALREEKRQQQKQKQEQTQERQEIKEQIQAAQTEKQIEETRQPETPKWGIDIPADRIIRPERARELAPQPDPPVRQPKRDRGPQL
jgi:hypothetical protein